MQAPQNASLINPFKTSQVEDFNFWYFLVGIVGVIYGTMSWQGTQAYNSSAKSAHEAKMASVLTAWRNLPMNIMFLFVPIIAYTVLNHPDFSGIANSVGGHAVEDRREGGAKSIESTAGADPYSPTRIDRRLCGDDAGRQYQHARRLHAFVGKYHRAGCHYPNSQEAVRAEAASSRAALGDYSSSACSLSSSA